MLGETHSVFQKSLYWLRDRGYVSWTQGHEPTCTYTVNPLFKSYEARKLLYDKIKNYHRLALPISLLVSSLSSGGVLLNVKGLFINHSFIKRESFSYACAREKEPEKERVPIPMSTFPPKRADAEKRNTVKYDPGEVQTRQEERLAEFAKRTRERIRGTRNWHTRIWDDVPDDIAKARDLEVCERLGITPKDSWFEPDIVREFPKMEVSKPIAPVVTPPVSVSAKPEAPKNIPSAVVSSNLREAPTNVSSTVVDKKEATQIPIVAPPKSKQDIERWPDGRPIIHPGHYEDEYAY